MTTAKQTLLPVALDEDAKTFSVTLRVPSPIVDAHPFFLYAPVAMRILHVYTQVRSTTPTDTVTASVLVDSTPLTSYTGFTATESSNIQHTAGTDGAANDVDAGEVVEVDITAIGGSNHTFYDIQLIGRIL